MPTFYKRVTLTTSFVKQEFVDDRSSRKFQAQQLDMENISDNDVTISFNGTSGTNHGTLQPGQTKTWNKINKFEVWVLGTSNDTVDIWASAKKTHLSFP